jgi:hypothetical protein
MLVGLTGMIQSYRPSPGDTGGHTDLFTCMNEPVKPLDGGMEGEKSKVQKCRNWPDFA